MRLKIPGLGLVKDFTDIAYGWSGPQTLAPARLCPPRQASGMQPPRPPAFLDLRQVEAHPDPCAQGPDPQALDRLWLP